MGGPSAELPMYLSIVIRYGARRRYGQVRNLFIPVGHK